MADYIVTVQALNSVYREPLTSIVRNSAHLNIEINNTYQLVFTAYDDNSIAFAALDSEASVFFSGQEFIVKSIETDAQDGFTTKQITAAHVYNEVSRVWQYDVKSGTLTYSVDDVLSFYFKNNKLGFTWKVYGTFDKQQITDLGNSSGKDCLSKIIETWPTAVIYPDNKIIRVYSADAFKQDLGGRIDYLHDTSEITLDSDSTSIINIQRAIGKTKDGDSDDKTTYYFDPFLVRDEDSIKKWGEHPGEDVSDERFTDKAAIQKYVLSQMTSEPSISISATLMAKGIPERPVLGEVKRVEIRPMSFVTSVEILAFTWYFLDPTQPLQYTLNNTAKTILDYQHRMQNNLKNAINNSKNNINISNVEELANRAYNSRIYGEVTAQSEY